MQLLDIPYERQVDNQTCGAASLCMVLRSFGLHATQSEVWPYIRNNESEHNRGARMPRVARYAWAEGIAAVVLHTQQPWSVLRRCFRPHLRVIIIHRRGFGSFGMHASVLRGLDTEAVVLHDPLSLPDRRMGRDDFLALWGPHPNATFGHGHTLAIFAQADLRVTACPCHQPGPETLACTACALPIPLLPAAAVGCGRFACGGWDWDAIFCPWCEASVACPGARP